MWSWIRRVVAAMFDAGMVKAAPIKYTEAPVEPVPEKQAEATPQPVDADGLFAPEEVLIYNHAVSYKPDGGFVMVSKDPIVLYRRVMHHGVEINNAIKVAYSPSKFADEARGRLTARLREVFGIPEPSEGGLSEAHLNALLSHFMKYCENIKKNLPPITTFQRATSPATTPYEEEEVEKPPATGTTSDSGSTAEGSSTESPGPSPSAPGSPQESSSQGWSTTVR